MATDVPESVTLEVQDLQEQWSALPPPGRAERLERLRPNFRSVQAMGKAMGMTEGRIRQLLKLAPRANQNETKPDPTISEAMQSESPSVLPRTVSQTQTEAPHAERENKETIGVKDGQLKQAAPAPPRAALTVQEPPKLLLAREVELGTTAPPDGSAKQPAVSKEQDRKAKVQAPVLNRKEQGEPKSREAECEASASVTRNDSKAGEPAAEAAVQDYAIKDPEVGGELVAKWIKTNFNPCHWLEVIDDYTTTVWFNRPTFQQGKLRLENISAGLTPCEVIKQCLSREIKEQLEGEDFQNARRKWFVRWASILLPDPATRRTAVEIAGRILQELAPRWTYLAYDENSKQPIPIVASQRIHLADFLEGLTKYVNLPRLLQNGGPIQAEVEQALQYAAATLRKGYPPRID